MLKVIVKNKETGIQKCIDIPKERENDTDIKALKVGMTVYHLEKMGMQPELVEVVKIVDDRPLAKTLPGEFTWNPFSFAGGAMGRASAIEKFAKKAQQARERARVTEEYQKKPYFNVKLDPIKGSSDHQENLEKIKFPCWCVYRYPLGGKDEIGMLITGLKALTIDIEYQLIDMMKQVPGKGTCNTIFRDTNLKALMEKCNIEIIKGESQLWKMGKFNV